MKKALYSILAAAALLSVSCTREMPTLSPEEIAGTPVTIRAYAEPETKTAYEKERTFSWVEGDKISLMIRRVSDGMPDVAVFTATSGGTDTTVFQGLIAPGYEMADYAFYPKGTGDTYYSSDLGAIIDETNKVLNLRMWGTITPDYDNPMSSIPLIAKRDEKGNFGFRTATGVLKVSVKNIPADAYFLKLDHSQSVALNGNYSFGEDCTLKMENIVGTAWPQKYAYFTPKAEGDSISFYLPIPVGEIPAGLKVTLSSESRGDILLATTAKPITITRNRVVETPVLTVPESEWKSIGTGKYMDDHGFYYMGKGGRTADDYVDVEIERNVINQNNFRLRKPYAEVDAELMADADEYLYFSVGSDATVTIQPYHWNQTDIMMQSEREVSYLYYNSRVLGYLADGITPSNIQLAPHYKDCVQDEITWLWGATCDNNPKIEIVFPGATPKLADNFNASNYGYLALASSNEQRNEYNVVIADSRIKRIDVVLAPSLQDGFNTLAYDSGLIYSFTSSGTFVVNAMSSQYDVVYVVYTTYNGYVIKHTGYHEFEITYKSVALTADLITPLATSSFEGSVAELVDGDIDTYWHSPYSGDTVAEPWNDATYGVYLDIELPSANLTTLDFQLRFCLRYCYNDHPDHVKIFASADGSEWGTAVAEMTDIYATYDYGNWTDFVQFYAPEGTRYLRLAILQSYGENGVTTDLTQGGCTHMAELQLYAR